MAKRIRLRTRVFLTAAAYGAVLLVVTLALTYRARQAQSELERVIDEDLAAITQVSRFIGNQNAYRSRIAGVAAINREEFVRIAASYRSVQQLVTSVPGDDPALRSLAAEVDQMNGVLQSLSRRWDELPQRERREELRRVESEMIRLSRQARKTVRAREATVRDARPLIRRKAEITMWTSLALAWIATVLIVAFARLTIASLVRPIERLARAAEQIASSDFAVRAPVSGDREIQELGLAFNRMAKNLERYDEQLKARARTDELTSLPNFRSFREAIDGELERATRYDEAFGLLIIDIDHFKSYNDRFGHLAGNEALKAVADSIRKNVRAVDLPARYGGEEFSVIVPEIDDLGLKTLAERVRTEVEAIPPIEGRSSVTISIGGAMFPLDGRTAEALFTAADTRLYQAKKEGRNRSVIPIAPEPVASGQRDAAGATRSEDKIRIS